MSNIKKPQKKFIDLLLTTLIVVQGKANFRNMSRYSPLSEKCFSRWYRRSFDFLSLNCLILKNIFSKANVLIAALDASFMSKSGKHTDGKAMFWRGCTGRAEPGLELSMLCVIDMAANTAYTLDAKQTIDKKEKTRVELYAEQAIKLANRLLNMGISYLAVDAYYYKEKFVSSVVRTGLHIVGKLRNDADLLWLYTGGYPGSGRPKTYDGKVRFDKDLKSFEYIGQLETGEKIFTAEVFSRCLKCRIRVVMLQFQHNGKIGTALLYSTDTTLDAMTIIQYYKARFQIEFVFRDAKQYTGLMDCQSCKKEAIQTHINASFTALNLLKLEDRIEKNTDSKTVISISSWKRRKFNQHLMCRVFDKLELPLSNEKVMDTYRELSKYGAIAA